MGRKRRRESYGPFWGSRGEKASRPLTCVQFRASTEKKTGAKLSNLCVFFLYWLLYVLGGNAKAIRTNKESERLNLISRSYKLIGMWVQNCFLKVFAASHFAFRFLICQPLKARAKFFNLKQIAKQETRWKFSLLLGLIFESSFSIKHWNMLHTIFEAKFC